MKFNYSVQYTKFILDIVGKEEEKAINRKEEKGEKCKFLCHNIK